MASLVLLLRIAIFLSLLAAFKYLVAPLMVWMTSSSARPRARRLRPDEASDEVKSAVRSLSQVVKPLGFELGEVADVNEGTAVVIHVYHPRTHDHLLSYSLPSHHWQVFRTQLPGGMEVVTTNSTVASVFSRPRTTFACQLPQWTDLPTLYRAHQAHLTLRSGGAEPIPTEVSGSYVEHYETRTLEKQCELGVHRRAGEKYRPTLRGAFLMTWRLLPPLKQLRASANQRIARRLLASD
jgi:hypothetical protein